MVPYRKVWDSRDSGSRCFEEIRKWYTDLDTISTGTTSMTGILPPSTHSPCLYGFSNDSHFSLDGISSFSLKTSSIPTPVY